MPPTRSHEINKQHYIEHVYNQSVNNMRIAEKKKLIGCQVHKNFIWPDRLLGLCGGQTGGLLLDKLCLLALSREEEEEEEAFFVMILEEAFGDNALWLSNPPP